MIKKRIQNFITMYLLIIIGIFSALFFFRNKNVFPNSNIILISIDHLQAKHLQKYGYPLNTTPNLDELLDTSYIFANAIAPSSWTLPSAISIFTSTYPEKNKMIRIFEDYTKEGTPGEKVKKLSGDIKTLTEVLKENKYHTAAFASKNFGFRSESGINRGFDTYFEAYAVKEKISLQPAIKKSIQWLRENKNKKFFIYIQGFDLHDKVDPIQGYDYKYVSKQYKGAYAGGRKEYEILKYDTKVINMSQEDVDFWYALYDEKINNVDKYLGEFFENLKKMKLLDKTLIIFTSAHGIEYYEHGKFNHGHTLYQELIHVPLAIRLPGQIKGKRIESLVSTIDIVPTILNLVNIKHSLKNQTQGINLSPAMFYDQDISRDVFSETHTFRPEDKWPEDIWSIISPNGLKYIYKMVSTEEGQLVERELYNIKKDPYERINLYDKERKSGYEMEQKLYQHSKKKLTSEFNRYD